MTLLKTIRGASMLSLTALATGNTHALTKALQSERDCLRFDKLCASAEKRLSDKQCLDVLLNKVQSYRWIRRFNSNETFRANILSDDTHGENHFGLTKPSPEVEEIARSQIQSLMDHHITPRYEEHQNIFIKEMTSDNGGSDMKDNTHFQAVVKHIPWTGMALTKVARTALFGLYHHSDIQLFSKDDALNFLDTWFEKFDWWSEYRNEILWENAILVMPTAMAQRMLILKPQIVEELNFIKSISFRTQGVEDILDTAVQCGLSLETVHTQFAHASIGQHLDGFKKAMEYIDYLKNQQQKNKIIDEIANEDQNGISTSRRRKM